MNPTSNIRGAPRRSILPVARRGRLLVECLVAMLLLNATALVATSLARGAGASIERARLVTAGWAMATRTLDTPLSMVGDSLCTTPDVAGAEVIGRVTGAWTERLNSAWRERDLSVTLTPSPWLGPPTRLFIRAARSCQ